MSETTLQTVISLGGNVLTLVIGGLFMRWIGLLVQNLRSDIRISKLEIENLLAQTYATKNELEAVRADIKLSQRMDANFAHVFSLLRSPNHAHSPEVVKS